MLAPLRRAGGDPGFGLFVGLVARLGILALPSEANPQEHEGLEWRWTASEMK